MGIADDVNDGRVSARSGVEVALRAMARLDVDLHFVAEPWHELARRLAGAVDDRPPGRRGELAGVPFMIKEGTGLDTPVVERLVAAGAIPIGTTTRPTPGAVSQSWGWNGRDHTRNPWRLDRSPGGSSAGSAVAVAARVVPFATGGDSAGSLRIPAAFCGVVGFKGTVGRLPRGAGRGLAQLTGSGVIGAGIDDVVIATRVASGSHPNDSTALPRWDPATTPVRRPPRVAFSAALGYSSPDPSVAELVRARVAESARAGLVELVSVRAELADPERAWLSLYALDQGRPVDHEDLTAALASRRELDRALAEMFAEIDALITPTTPQTAYPYLEYEDHLPACQLCWAFNLSGHPAITVPIGLLDGLPVGAQVVAPPHQDDVAIQVARLIDASPLIPPDRPTSS
ncbi:amidase [Microlunatus speluncae]|uniref:amidase n=1 Tax=Microlunatus speluncae TaxID=2594267 RepID=UPI001266880A|nr:amidase [Microlunatus speluncae]